MKRTILIALMAIAIMGCSDKKIKLTGAGATFPLPFYGLAFKAYQDATTTKVDYGAIGSGGGVRSLENKVVDFAASDAYLSNKEMSKMEGKVLHIPTCMGAVVLAYNLDGVKDLRLNAEIISDIYLGKITKWNDEKISSINPNISLPEIDIQPVYRSDGSGTTFVFSDYMSKTSSEWKEKMGRGKSLKWNCGVAAKGNPGVSGIVKQTNGAIGYIGSEYAFAQKIPTALLKNANGEFVKANIESITKASWGDIAADTRQMITNSEAKGAYPISCLTWLLIYEDLSISCKDEETAKQTYHFINWIISKEAQALTEKAHYAPLSSLVVKRAKDILESVNYKGKSLNEGQAIQ